MKSPPFQITTQATALMAKIERLLGQIDASTASRPAPSLRKQNRIRTIKDSLAIEGNTLSLEQVTAIFENKRVVGPRKEVLEVQNAIKAYEMASGWKPVLEKDFKKAHAVLMKGLLDPAGRYRNGSVGVLKNGKVSHVAPQAHQVPRLMSELFTFANKHGKQLSPLVASAVMHYEIEFIHPFDDGNGRVGRLWHHVFLRNYHPAFEVVPFESLIKSNQKKYYDVLERCDLAGESTLFVEFSLELLLEAVQSLFLSSPRRRLTQEERLENAKLHFKAKWFSRKDYQLLFPEASAPTMSRDLAAGVKSKQLVKRGKFNGTEYKFVP